MAGIEKLRGAISASLSDSNFSARAATLPDGELRQAIAIRLCSLDIVVIAASGLADSPPHPAAEIVWQPGEGGDFVRQTVVWNIAPWALPQSAGVVASSDVIGAPGDAGSEDHAS